MHYCVLAPNTNTILNKNLVYNHHFMVEYIFSHSEDICRYALAEIKTSVRNETCKQQIREKEENTMQYLNNILDCITVAAIAVIVFPIFVSVNSTLSFVATVLCVAMFFESVNGQATDLYVAINSILVKFAAISFVAVCMMLVAIFFATVNFVAVNFAAASLTSVDSCVAINFAISTFAMFVAMNFVAINLISNKVNSAADAICNQHKINKIHNNYKILRKRNLNMLLLNLVSVF